MTHYRGYGSGVAWRDMGFYVLMFLGAVGFSALMIVALEADRANLAREVAEGTRLATGEPIVRDQKTGCQYIRSKSSDSGFASGPGYVLTPRYTEDGVTVMGCGKK